MALFSARSFQINNPAALGTGCGKCRLHKTCRSPKMEPYGDGSSGLMFIGESPGDGEDKLNTPLVGMSGKMLDGYLRQEGIEPETIIKLNAVACRPTEARDPTGMEIEACRGRVFAAIEKYKPKVIVPLGMVALESLIGHRWPKKKDEKQSGLGSMSRWFNWNIPDRQTKCWIIPNYHPAYILRTRKENKDGSEPPNPAAELWFETGIQNAVDHLAIQMPHFKDEESCVEILTDDNTCAALLQRIWSEEPFIVFDYEGSGLKPYRKGHRIWYIGIAYGPNKAICFPTQGMKKSLSIFRQMMSDSTLGKIAHNMMYEDLWTRERLGVQVEGWVLDTIQSAHIIDQRPGITGLKFQTYVQSGLIDYSSHINEYLATPLNAAEADMGANGFNRISLAPPKQVMMYCGIDCIGTYRLALHHGELLHLDFMNVPF